MACRRCKRYVLGLALLVWACLTLPALAAPPVQGEQGVHVVQAGETLSVIAARYGVTVEAIVAANGLVDPDVLRVGQRLAIPGPWSSVQPTTLYVVQPGDTLALICRRYQVNVDEVANQNHLANPNLIYVGQRLLIPLPGEQETQPTPGRVHVVQPGETAAKIAARYGTTVWAIAQASGIGNPNVIQVGQRLLVPVPTGQSSLPLPFLEVDVLPVVAYQGQTVQIVVETDGRADVSGTLNGVALTFVGGEGHYRALVGIHPLAPPGPYMLSLRAVQGDKSVSVGNMVQVAEGDFAVQYLSFTPDKAALLEPSLLAAEAKRLRELTSVVTLPGLWHGRFGVPLAGAPGISAPFGARRSYDGGPPTDYHSGVDYVADEGTPVLCPAHGRVVLAEALTVRGNAVVIDHGRGVMSGYWHLSRIDVVVGQKVSPGDQLGLVGNTGLSTGPHLHWEVRVMGVHVDPLQWTRENIQ